MFIDQLRGRTNIFGFQGSRSKKSNPDIDQTQPNSARKFGVWSFPQFFISIFNFFFSFLIGSNNDLVLSLNSSKNEDLSGELVGKKQLEFVNLKTLIELIQD